MESFPIPATVVNEEILSRLDLESLSSLASVNKLLRSAVVSHALPLLSSLDFPTLSPDAVTLKHILRRCLGVRRLSLSCLRLPEPALHSLRSPSLVELNLFACHFLPDLILDSIAQSCPNLRELTVEFSSMESPVLLRNRIRHLVEGCRYLECLCLRIRTTKPSGPSTLCVMDLMPKTIKVLKVHPVLEDEVFYALHQFRIKSTDMGGFGMMLPPSTPAYQLQSLSLVLDFISDRVLTEIAGIFPMLLDLELEDKPYKEPHPSQDLTNAGLQTLGCFQHLRRLSLMRSKQNHPVSFKRINDMGMFLLSEACKGLESVRLCGFSKVTDAGYASILQSCKNLKKLEVRNALYLSDLAFHDLNGDQCALFEVRLSSSNLITSESVKKLATSRSLEVLDLGGCKSVDDDCLGALSCLSRLTALNLMGADITDNGLLALSKLNSPITSLCLRGCKRVTDRGIRNLLHGGGMISKKLVTLDLGYMPGISDKGIHEITKTGVEITELCIRYCFYVTDSSLKALAAKKEAQNGSKPLKRLDLYNCTGLSIESRKMLQKPWFPGLHWVGIGKTQLGNQRCGYGHDPNRPWLTICLDGCEMGCQDGWQYHRPVRDRF